MLENTVDLVLAHPFEMLIDGIVIVARKQLCRRAVAIQHIGSYELIGRVIPEVRPHIHGCIRVVGCTSEPVQPPIMDRVAVGREAKPALVTEHNFSVQRVGRWNGRGRRSRLVKLYFIDPSGNGGT
ncbi:hypothetical protein D3C87_1738300 [compost metagenome]